MVLNGIPISDDECIGDSLATINSAFQSISSAVTQVESNSAFNVVDSPTIDLNWNASTRTLSATTSSISSFFTGTGTQLLSSSGYQKLPGGLIIQWGYLDDQSTTRNFPITFPTACVSLVAGYAVDSYSTSNGPFVWVVSLSQFRLRQGQNAGDANMFWQAIGY